MSNKTEQLDKAYSESAIALGEAAIAMDKLAALVTSKQLPKEDFLTFMGAISHRHAKLLKRLTEEG